MALIQSGNSADLLTVDPTAKAARVTLYDTAGSPLAAAAPTPVPTRGNAVDRSGTIALGGTSQQLMAANATRVYFLIENVSTGDLWFNYGIAAVVGQPSIKIPAGGSYENPPHFVDPRAINIIGATTTAPFVSKEF